VPVLARRGRAVLLLLLLLLLLLAVVAVVAVTVEACRRACGRCGGGGRTSKRSPSSCPLRGTCSGTRSMNAAAGDDSGDFGRKGGGGG
jgi:uncharacterized membrane protein